MEKKKQNYRGICEECMYFDYDEDYDEYVCTQSSLDEDEYAKIMEDSHYQCPFFARGNEYTIVRKQM